MPELEIPDGGGAFVRRHHQDEQWAHRTAEGVLDRGLRRRLHVPLGATSWQLLRTEVINPWDNKPLTWWHFLTESDYATKVVAFTTVPVGGVSLHIGGYFRRPPTFTRLHVFRFTQMQAWETLPCERCAKPRYGRHSHKNVSFNTRAEVRAAIAKVVEGW